MRALARRAASILALGAALAFAPDAAAYSDPDLDWYTIETKHFRIHYDRPLEPIASRVASLAEVIHDRIAPYLGYTPTQVTQIVITDDSESANGSAGALPRNTIRLYVTAPDDLSPLSDYDDWYTSLVTHEYTHIAHTDTISGLPAIVNAVLGKTLAPNQVQPRWILEGLAVVSESQHTSGGRIRASLFDMFLRADVIADRIAGLDQISSTPYRYPGGNLWYLYGSRFLRWITDVYGPDTMRAVSRDYGSWIVPWGLNRSIRRATGSTYPELYEGFKDHIKRLYAEQMRAVHKRGLREGTRITRHGRTLAYPRFLPRVAREGDAEELYYYREDGNTRAGLYRIPLAAPKEGERSEELVARTIGSTSPTFTPTGDLLFHSAAIFKNYYSRDDLFLLPRGQRSPQGEESARKRLTIGQRAQYADVSPDGRQVVFTVNARGTSFLEIADLTPEGKLQNKRDLAPSQRFEQVYTPRFSPDGRTVAYSVWSAGGYRDIRLVDVATGKLRDVTRDRAIDMTPVWSSDGKALYFVSDRTGIFNVYAHDLAKGTFAQITNVRTGAFQPAISADEKTLVYVGYTSYGYDLYAMPLDRARFLPAIDMLPERPDPPTEPPPLVHRPKRYNPLPTFGPTNYLLNIKPGVYGPNAVTFTTTAADVVGMHALSATINAEPSGPSPSFNLDYYFNRLPVDFEAHFFHNVVPRGGYVVNGKEIKYDEYNNGISVGVAYAHREEFASHRVGLSFNVAGFRGDLPVGSKLDPYSPVITDPPRGTINVVHLGYSYNNVEGSYDASGAIRGVALGVALDYAGPYVGSTYSLRGISGSVTGYIPMPWSRWHTLALRAAGAIQDGDYPRGSPYTVGGYDLAGTSLPSEVMSGVFNGSFVLRGYPPRVYRGKQYLLTNIEYRFPILYPDHGISTLPLFLRRIDGNVFLDYGGAFDYLDLRGIRFFHHGALIDSRQLHASVGAELWLNLSLGYVLGTQIRIGYAYGFSEEAVKGGQPYFVASTAF
ncbi:tolB protein precursor [Minicystis rosea]|nr:tolB protein precursor [Minicystis rosea]